MDQENPYRYRVDPTERVTVKIRPQNRARAEAVTASLDGETLQNKGSEGALCFEFDADQALNHRHYLAIDFAFIDQDPNEAYYNLEFCGARGGTFDPGKVRRVVCYPRPQYVFRVQKVETDR